MQSTLVWHDPEGVPCAAGETLPNAVPRTGVRCATAKEIGDSACHACPTIQRCRRIPTRGGAQRPERLAHIQ